MLKKNMSNFFSIPVYEIGAQCGIYECISSVYYDTYYLSGFAWTDSNGVFTFFCGHPHTSCTRVHFWSLDFTDSKG